MTNKRSHVFRSDFCLFGTDVIYFRIFIRLTYEKRIFSYFLVKVISPELRDSVNPMVVRGHRPDEFLFDINSFL